MWRMSIWMLVLNRKPVTLKLLKQHQSQEFSRLIFGVLSGNAVNPRGKCGDSGLSSPCQPPEKHSV